VRSFVPVRGGGVGIGWGTSRIWISRKNDSRTYESAGPRRSAPGRTSGARLGTRLSPRAVRCAAVPCARRCRHLFGRRRLVVSLAAVEVGVWPDHLHDGLRLRSAHSASAAATALVSRARLAQLQRGPYCCGLDPCACPRATAMRKGAAVEEWDAPASQSRGFWPPTHTRTTCIMSPRVLTQLLRAGKLEAIASGEIRRNGNISPAAHTVPNFQIRSLVNLPPLPCNSTHALRGCRAGALKARAYSPIEMQTIIDCSSPVRCRRCVCSRAEARAVSQQPSSLPCRKDEERPLRQRNVQRAQRREREKQSDAWTRGVHPPLVSHTCELLSAEWCSQPRLNLTVRCSQPCLMDTAARLSRPPTAHKRQTPHNAVPVRFNAAGLAESPKDVGPSV